MKDVNAPVAQRPLWVRSPRGTIAGVCQSLADALDVEAWIVRVIWVLATLFLGLPLLLYIMLAVSLPRADRWEEAQRPMILGVCWRLSRRTDLEVGLMRFLALCLAVLSLGATILAYVVLHFLVPRD